MKQYNLSNDECQTIIDLIQDAKEEAMKKHNHFLNDKEELKMVERIEKELLK